LRLTRWWLPRRRRTILVLENLSEAYQECGRPRGGIVGDARRTRLYIGAVNGKLRLDKRNPGKEGFTGTVWRKPTSGFGVGDQSRHDSLIVCV